MGDNRKWYAITYKFNHGDKEHIETVESFTDSLKGAEGSTWAVLLIRFPGAIYVNTSYDDGTTWVH